MAGTLSKGTLFPEVLTNELFNLVKGKSSLAKLAGKSPLPFNGTQAFTFNLDKEVDLVDENGAKSNGGATIAPVTMNPVKIEYGLRVSNEFMYAAEEVQIGYLRAFADGFAAKAARGLDIMAFHGVNPRTGSASSLIGTNHFDAKVSQTVTRTADANADVESAIALVTGNEEMVNGMAMSPGFRSALAALTYATDGRPMFQELAWGTQPSNIKGLAVDINSTVSFRTAPDQAIVGNFADYFRYGIAKEIPMKVIEYGCPDNDTEAGDLQGHNQVYIRAEMFLGWGILLPEAFARIISA